MENNSIEIYFKDSKTESLLTAEEEVELSKKKDIGDTKARDKLITSNLRLVISIAKNYQNHGCDLEDLIQEGNIGLMDGVTKFEWVRGYRLSTYVTWWIRQKIDRYISNHGKNVRVPVHVLTLTNKLKKTLESYREQFNSEPSIQEISSLLNCSEDMAKEAYMTLNGNYISMDDKNLSNITQKIQDTSETPLDNIINNDIYKVLKSTIKQLSPRDEKIIRLRFGIQESEKDHENFPITEDELNELKERSKKAKEINN